MAFSQSFEFGNSTLLKIESQVQHVMNNMDAEPAGGVQEIQESPQEDAKSFLGKTYNKSKVRFRRSISDSTIPKALSAISSNLHSKYEFFRSDFDFSSTWDGKEDTNAEKPCDEVHLSQFAAELHDAFKDDEMIDVNALSSHLDMPIFSEDVKDLVESEELGAQLDNSISLLAIEKLHHSGVETDTAEEVFSIDESSFICHPIERSVAKELTEQIKGNLHQSAIKRTLPLPGLGKKSDCTFSAVITNNKQSRSTCKSGTEPSYLQKSESAINLTAWNLPQSILQQYKKKGILKMFDWQVECLSNPKVLFEHKNLVYSAPTSAGKTLVSEILLLKSVLERNKKVLIILPFISVVREKMLYLQDLLTSSGYRVEGFFGGYSPPGGFDSIHIAICTIEKANSIVNRLLEQGKLNDIGTIVVDEVHLISDPGRGYILELLLAKVLYMSRAYDMQIQVITMSATIANEELLKRWLDAELYMTDFRPVELHEMIKVGSKIYDRQMKFLRDVTDPVDGKEYEFPRLQNDSDHVAQLCIETLLEGCSAVVFCPSKDWCENLAKQLACAIYTLSKTDESWRSRLSSCIKPEAIENVKQQLRGIPTGLDPVLEKAVSFACAFHHAGLTTEERDIIETSFKAGTLKVIVATSTLSSGVNLPARRVLIRSPLFGGKQMNSLTYRQMIGRAGRTGKDTVGESILICTESNSRVGQELISADIKPISSCLDLDGSVHLKRALLEVISSGVASTKTEVEVFVNCTLLSAQRQQQDEKNSTNESKNDIEGALNFLVEFEFVRLQKKDETHEENYIATSLGIACLASSMSPCDGLVLFAELQKSRRCFVLESDLHAVYLVTPYSVCYQLQDLDWLLFLDIWERLSPAMKKVGELVGVKESFLVRAMRGQTKLDHKLMQIHKRFYTALALQELINETPINHVTVKYKCTRGMLQSLQQMASTFAGIVTAFCNSLQWSTLSLVVSQFKERLFFGIHRDLIDLMRLPDLNHKRARVLFDAGINTLVDLANADAFTVEKLLHNAYSFDSAKRHDNENDSQAEKRVVERIFFITGKPGMTVAESAKSLVQEARKFVQYDIGVNKINWTQHDIADKEHQLNMSCEREDLEGRDNRELSSLKRNNEEEKQEATPPKLLKEKLNSSNCSKDIENFLSPFSIEKQGSHLDNRKETDGIQKKSNKVQPLVESKMVANLNNEESPNIMHNFTKVTTAQKRKNKLAGTIKSDGNNEEHLNRSPKTGGERYSSKPHKMPEPVITKPRRSPRFSSTRISSLACERDSNTMKIAMCSTMITADMLKKNLTSELNENDDNALASADDRKELSEISDLHQLQNHAVLNKLGSRTLRNHHKSIINQQHSKRRELTGSSIDLSDFSADSSLIKNPLQLNASHVLSSAKADSDASSLKSIEIVDICGNRQLFELAFQELTAKKRFGFSLGLQRTIGKRKPIIGSNLLINQYAAAQDDAAAKDSVIFQIDDLTYVAGCAFGVGNNLVYYMNLQKENTCKNLTTELKCKYLRMLFQTHENVFLIFDTKEQLKLVRKFLPELTDILAGLEDPKVGNWLLQPDKESNLQQMVHQFAPECVALVNLCSTGRGYNSFGLDAENTILAKVRCSIEACASEHILKEQIENLQRIGTGQLYKFFHEIEMPLQRSLCDMEVTGFPANETALQQLFKKMVETMKRLEDIIFKMHGSRFNLSSASGVAKVLGLHRRANGRASTSKQVLEKIDSPISQSIIAYRKLSTTLTKSLQPLLKCIQDGRIHGQSVTFTATGRITMTEPNLQNIAKDFDVNLGSEVVKISCRSAFFPSDTTRCLISSDFCQLEMRILAHLSQDPSLLQVVNTEKDIFIAIAARWNKIEEARVSEQLRNGTKQICYGIIYGMGVHALAEALKCTEQEALFVSTQFHAAYPGIRVYAEKVVKFAQQNGYIETITGRRRYLENIQHVEPQLRKQAERQAINSTIQGSAADIAKTAILRMEKNIDKYGAKLGITRATVRLVLHLHDELIFEVPEEKARKVAKVLSLTMENCVKLSVPLKVKLRVGKSWGELREIKL